MGEQRGQAEILVGKFLGKWEIPKFLEKGSDCLWSPQPVCLPSPEMGHGLGGSVLRLLSIRTIFPVPRNSSHSFILFSCCSAGIIFPFTKGLQSSRSPSHRGQVTAMTTAGRTQEKQCGDVAAKSPPCLPKFPSLLTPQVMSMGQPTSKQPWMATENQSDIKGF